MNTFPAIMPDCIYLLTLALYAGRAGCSLLVGLRGYPTPIRGAVDEWLFSQFTPNQAVHVFDVGDVRHVFKQETLPRVIVLEDPKLAEDVAARLVGCGQLRDATAPVVVFDGDEGLTELPVSTILLDADKDELAAVQAWRWGDAGQLQHPGVAAEDPVGIDVPAALREAVFLSDSTNTTSSVVMAEMMVVKTLLVGASVLRLTFSGKMNDNVTVNVVDFECVHALVGRVAARAPDGHSDPLASAMVWRGNLYNEMLASRSQAASVKLARIHETSKGAAASGDSGEITRRELEDLGNVESRVIRDVIKFLDDNYTDGVAEPDQAGAKPTTRRGWLTAIGVARELPDHWRWPTENVVATIRPMLRTWSRKLIRNHFHPLRAAGVITGEREYGNSPWVYRLPEGYAPTSAFSWLPSPEEVRRAVEASEILPATTQPDLPLLSLAGPTARANQTDCDANS